jgi:hypothetical protein
MLSFSRDDVNNTRGDDDMSLGNQRTQLSDSFAGGRWISVPMLTPWTPAVTINAGDGGDLVGGWAVDDVVGEFWDGDEQQADVDTQAVGLQLIVNGLLGLMMAILCLTTVVGNALVVHAVRTDRKLQTVSYCFAIARV